MYLFQNNKMLPESLSQLMEIPVPKELGFRHSIFVEWLNIENLVSINWLSIYSDNLFVHFIYNCGKHLVI